MTLAAAASEEADADEEEGEEKDEVREKVEKGGGFRAVGVNSFHHVVQQPFSTFSIDVDTAAYTVSRNYMNRGLLPPAEAVRHLRSTKPRSLTRSQASGNVKAAMRARIRTYS